jgi:hypothetical protein
MIAIFSADATANTRLGLHFTLATACVTPSLSLARKYKLIEGLVRLSERATGSRIAGVLSLHRIALGFELAGKVHLIVKRS